MATSLLLNVSPKMIAFIICHASIHCIISNPTFAITNVTAPPTLITPSILSTATYTNSPTRQSSSLPVTITHNASCGSFIQDALTFAGEKHYYLFINTYGNLDVTISTCPTKYHSEFDTDITVYDANMSQLAYTDGGCRKFRALLHQTWSIGTYIIMLDDFYDTGIGQYYIEFICDIITTAGPSYDLSQITANDLCFTGANNSVYDGTYQFYSTSPNISGLVWYNPINQRYLYPWDWGTSVSWRIGQSHISPWASVSCSYAQS